MLNTDGYLSNFAGRECRRLSKYVSHDSSQGIGTRIDWMLRIIMERSDGIMLKK